MLCRAAAAKRGAFVPLPLCATAAATGRGLSGPKPAAAADGTGLESRHPSRHFVTRAGRAHTARTYTKLTAACDTRGHFFAGATVAAGPSNDSPGFRPAMTLAAPAVRWDRVLAAAAFGREGHHGFCRDDPRVRATVIPLDRRDRGRKWPRAKYRRQAVKRFRKKPKGSRHQRVYGQRWQAESAFPRHKRRLGSPLAARSDAARERECRLRVLTHNPMLLAAGRSSAARAGSGA